MSEPLPKFVGMVIGKLITTDKDMRAGKDLSVGRRWLDRLAALGLLDQTSRNPPAWKVSKEGRKVLDEAWK